MKIQATDFTTALDAADKGNFEAYLYSWSGRPDPDGNTFSFLACKTPLNYARYCSPEADAALAGRARRPSTRPSARPPGRRWPTGCMADRPLHLHLPPQAVLGLQPRSSRASRPIPDGLVRFTGLKLN